MLDNMRLLLRHDYSHYETPVGTTKLFHGTLCYLGGGELIPSHEEHHLPTTRPFCLVAVILY